MWFVVIVLKIENGGEEYEVLGWSGRGGRKSGLRVGGMIFLIGLGGGGGIKSPLGGGGVEFSGFSLTLVVISPRDTNHSTNLMIIGPKRIESIILSFFGEFVIEFRGF